MKRRRGEGSIRQDTWGGDIYGEGACPHGGPLEKRGLADGKRVLEVRRDNVDEFEVGQEIKVDTLAAGEFVDVTAVSKGKGFAGTMKRHNFSGQRASHGAHRVHRAPGSVGACATPARVFKGKKMAGRMGAEKVTTLNWRVGSADPEKNLLLVRGVGPFW